MGLTNTIEFSQNENQGNIPKTDSNMVNNEIFYEPTDKGPFIVYLETTEKVGFNIGRANNIKIARDIFNLNLTDVLKISNKGLNRISVHFLSFKAANSFIKNKSLLDKGYKIYIPFNFVTAKGIARRVDLDLSEQELLQACESHDKIKIISAKRLNRRVTKDKITTYEPTSTVLFTFRGVRLPRYVKFFYLEFPIEIYIPPVTQCYRCLRYGHTRNNCKGKEKCFNCADEVHLQENEEPTCDSCCFFCKDNHKSNYKKCPEYIRQKNIKELMAFENLTFFEANENCRKTYISKGDFIYNPSDFPSMKRGNNVSIGNSKSTSETFIEPNERRAQAFRTNTTKRSFQHVTSADPIKKRIINKGYDRKAHEENIYFPNSRPEKQMLPSSQTLTLNPNFSQHKKQEMPSTSAPSDSFSFKHFDLHSVINYLRNTSDNNKNICRDLLLSECRNESYMDLDRYSDSG